jgi:hypothetical protein
MDFNRGTQPSSAARPAPAAAHHSAGGAAGGGKVRGWRGSPKWLRVLWVVLLFAVTVLAVAILALMYYGNAKEVDYVDADRHQAVFLTNGQVYFGKVKTISKQYIDLRGIYYLNVNQQVQPDQKNGQQAAAQNNVTLVKLGCELHGPVDQMLVNRDQVTFWENLKDDGQVAKAIDQWVKENPNGQQCANADTSTGGDADAAKP